MTKSQDQTGPVVPEPGPGARSLSRRALVRIGWVVPVVLAVGIPRDAFATYDGDPTSSPPPPRDDDGWDRDKGKDKDKDRDDDDDRDRGRNDDKKDKNRGGRR